MNAVEFLMYFFIIVSGALGFIVIAGLGYFIKRLNKVRVAYFETQEQCRLLTSAIIEGRINIGDEAFIVSDATHKIKPVMIKTRFGWMPLYRCDHGVKYATPWMKSEFTKESPDAIKATATLSTLKQIISKSQTPVWMYILLLVAGIGIGAMLLFVLIAGGIISIPGSASTAISGPPAPPMQSIGFLIGGMLK